VTQYRSSSARSAAAEPEAGAEESLAAGCPAGCEEGENHRTEEKAEIRDGLWQWINPSSDAVFILRHSQAARHDPFGLSALFCA
jgi:hypothetical protein